MENKLNKEQVAYVSKWIKARGVTYYDVNMEMTDHLASEIEVLMDAENFKFYDATKEAFSKYRRFHFMNIEEEKVKQLENQSWQEFKTEFKAFFTLPKVVITLFIFMSIYTSIAFFDYENVYWIFIVLGILIFTVMFARNWLFLGKRRYLQLLKYNTFMVVTSQVMFQVPRILTGYDIAIWIKSAILTLVALSILIIVELYSKELQKLKAQIV